MVSITKMIYFDSRKKWRSWLEKNHNFKKEIWLIFYKKHVGKTSISYDAAVEEALCFGWIDGIMKRLDEEKYVLRFSPRNPDSVWSLLNKKRVLKMTKEGRMAEAGLNKVKFAKETGKWQAAYSSKAKPGLPPDLKRALKENAKANKNFNNLTNSQQLSYIFWILGAKRKETREKRIGAVVRKSSQNLKPV